MLIECVLKRPGGSHVELPPITYHFKPREDGKHVAEVSNSDHLKILLKIDGYQIADDADDLEPTPAPAGDDTQDVDVDLPPIDHPTDSDAAGESTAPIAAEAGDTEEQEDSESGEGEGAQVPLPAAEGYEALSDEALNKLHLERLGRSPHPAAKRETIITKLKMLDEAGE